MKHAVTLGAVLVSPWLLALACAACTDPVRDARIDALGPEDPEVTPGPDHRPGQPCLVCHSAGGPAKEAFAVAGTIYASEAADAPGAADIEVRFIDSSGGGPPRDPVTGVSGNFYVRAADWDVVFPFRVGIARRGEERVAQLMQTTVNREGSCNACHQPNVGLPLGADDAERARQSIGQIYLVPGGGP